MAWPDHVKNGIPARALLEDIITVCKVRLEDPSIGAVARGLYELIFAHAVLDRANHAHGLLRDFVKTDGTGKAPGKLDAAWDQVYAAYQELQKPLPDLLTALDGIDHGGGG